MLTIIVQSKKENDKNKQKKQKYLKKESFKVLLYFILIVLLSVLISTISVLMISNIFNMDNKYISNLILMAISLFLLIVHNIIDGVKWKILGSYTFALIGILILYSLLFTLLFKNTINQDEYSKIVSVILALLMIYSVYVFHKSAHQFLKISTLEDKVLEGGHKEHLIMFLSVLRTNDKEEYFRKLISKAKNANRKTFLEVAKLIDSDHKSNSYHPWEMNLRAIHKHINHINGGLKRITLLASFEKLKPLDKSSMQQVHILINFLYKFLDANYRNKKVDINLVIASRDKYKILSKIESLSTMNYTKGIKFDEIDDVKKALFFVLASGHNDQFEASDTVIDMTAGQKTTSAAAAIVASKLPVYNQYVHTNGAKKVYSYNQKIGNSASF